MTNYFLLIVLQLAIGLGFGFYLSRAETNLSKNEIKLGAATILIVSGIVLFEAESPTVQFALMNLLSVVSLLGGLILGEWLHSRLVKRVLRHVDKYMIYQSIEDLVRETKLGSICPQRKVPSTVNIQLVETLKVLDEAEQSAVAFKQKELAEKVRKLSVLCIEFADIGEELKRGNPLVKENYSALTQKIQSFAWDTLRKMEGNVEKDLRHSWNTIRYALRTVNIRN